MSVKKLVLSQCKAHLCIPGGTGESSRDDPTLGGNTIFWQFDHPPHHVSHVCSVWRPYSASSDRKKDDALGTQMASVNMAFRNTVVGWGSVKGWQNPK